MFRDPTAPAPGKLTGSEEKCTLSHPPSARTSNQKRVSLFLEREHAAAGTRTLFVRIALLPVAGKDPCRNRRGLCETGINRRGRSDRVGQADGILGLLESSCSKRAEIVFAQNYATIGSVFPLEAPRSKEFRNARRPTPRRFRRRGTRRRRRASGFFAAIRRAG